MNHYLGNQVENIRLNFVEIDEPRVIEILCFMEEDVGPNINIIIIIILDVWQLSMKWFILIHRIPHSDSVMIFPI